MFKYVYMDTDKVTCGIIITFISLKGIPLPVICICTLPNRNTYIVKIISCSIKRTKFQKHNSLFSHVSVYGRRDPSR
jgi:hypothetical protein